MATELFGFDVALQLLKAGGRVARTGWNGKGMFIFLASCSPNEIVGNGPGTDMLNADSQFICMKPAHGPLVVGWLASQTDLLSEDWEEVP